MEALAEASRFAQFPVALLEAAASTARSPVLPISPPAFHTAWRVSVLFIPWGTTRRAPAEPGSACVHAAPVNKAANNASRCVVARRGAVALLIPAPKRP